jgi:flagellar basal body-associated protein FliL
MTYDQLSTPEGKQRAKITLRQNLNKTLNHGRVRRVLFDIVILKP